MQPKVSVIVPVYNVSAYIERCARSLFEQTLDELEILFINDCTPDNSIEIIKRVLSEYPKRLPLTRIIQLPSNGGQADARRIGMIEASGAFIIHCDGDDWVDIDLYEKMYKQAVIDDADIVICDRYVEYSDRAILKSYDRRFILGREIVKNYYVHAFAMFCWDKLVKRSLYIDNNILPWRALNMWEDNGLMTRILYYSEKISYVKSTYYHYNRTNPSATTVGYGEQHVLQMIGIAQNLTAFFKSKPDYENFEKTVLAFQFLAKINLITDKFSGIAKYKRTFPGAEKIASELDTSVFSFKGRLRFYFVKHHLAWIFVLLFKLKNTLQSLMAIRIVSLS
jgi:glycosyltransferase involved in cell wall biosynthesis